MDGPSRTVLVQARLANLARLNSVEGSEVRILLPPGAKLVSGSEATVQVEEIRDTEDVTWNITVPRTSSMEIFCIVDSENGGTDQASLIL